MATTKTIQPTGETITIPAMADQPDMSVVATDLGNITDAVNAQNQALSKVDTAHNFGQYTSLDTFKNDLLTFMRNVASFKTVAIQFVFTQTVEPFTAWSTFSGYAHCIQNGSTSLYFSCDVTSNNGEDISIGYSNGTWNINKLAFIKQGNISVTITDTNNGFIDSGITTSNYMMLSAHTLASSNNNVRISNLGSGGNYRFQIINAVTGEVQKSGSAVVYFSYMPRY